jgi:hypothetical protein
MKAAFTSHFPWRRDSAPAGLYQFDPAADRYPRIANPAIVTPYFAHFLLPELARRGELDFVLEVFRRCWGWALGQQSGTWLELFDPRSSQCHQWSSCPTWQLSEFVLGLRPARHRHPMGFELSLLPSSVPGASGVLPIAGTPHRIAVRWERDPEGTVAVVVTPSAAIRLFTSAGTEGGSFDVSAGEAREIRNPGGMRACARDAT